LESKILKLELEASKYISAGQISNVWLFIPPWDIPYSYKKLSALLIPNNRACKSSSGKYFLVPYLSDSNDASVNSQYSK
jgi:hypothetical protein